MRPRRPCWAVFQSLPSLRAPEAIITWARAVTVRTAIRVARQHDLEVAAEGTLTIVVAFAARRLNSLTLLAHLEYRRHRSHDGRAALVKIDQELHAIERLAVEYGR